MGQCLRADVRFVHRAPAHGTCATPNILLTKPNDCQAERLSKRETRTRPASAPRTRRTAFRPLPMEFPSKGTTAFGLVPALYHQTGDAGLPFLLIAIAAIVFSRGRLSASHPTANPQEAATNRVLLMAGIAAVVVYVIGDLLSAVMYDGYSYIDQAISELSAFGSPVRPLPPFVHTHSHDPCSAAGFPHVARTPGRHPSRTWKRAFCWQPLQIAAGKSTYRHSVAGRGSSKSRQLPRQQQPGRTASLPYGPGSCHSTRGAMFASANQLSDTDRCHRLPGIQPRRPEPASSATPTSALHPPEATRALSTAPADTRNN
jgi:hypothetical protein